MEENTAVKILKGAVLLEIRGKSFYQKVANDAESKAVRDFFEQMAGEEERHIKALSHQYKAYQANGKFDPDAIPPVEKSDPAQKVLSDKIKQQISAAGFEAAAIGAAMAMEREAIQYYSGRADESEDSGEKALYGWLADWETGHLDMLAEIDKALRLEIWNDNQFWPF
jgi:rubrerythrin